MTLGRVIYSAITERDDSKFDHLLKDIGRELDHIVDAKIAERRAAQELIAAEKSAALIEAIKRDNARQSKGTG
jgi:hypothetical protein